MPKVSVVIPVYGVEKYIERCARSLFEQTLDDIEYLFIDDCSPDKSVIILENVLEDYPNRKPQVTIHHMEQNSGQAKVREWGMRKAKGEYIIHCDSDDWVDLDFYEKLIEATENGKKDIIVCPIVVTDGSYKRYMKISNSQNPNDFLSDILLAKTNWSLCNKLIKRSLIISNIVYPKVNMGEDLALTAQFLLNANSIVTLQKKPCYYYYTNQESITRQEEAGKIINRFNWACENLRVVENAMKIKGKSTSILVFQKNKQRNIVIPAISSKATFFLWFNTFPEINWRIIFSTFIPTKEKIRFIRTIFMNIKYLF